MKILISNKLGDKISFDDAREEVQGIEYANGSTKIMLLHKEYKTSRHVVIDGVTFEDVAEAVGWADCKQ